MARIARVVGTGLPHHVTQEGNNRQKVFFDQEDRREFLRILALCAKEFQLEILAYSLLKDHVHFLVIPQRIFSMARGIGRTNLIYTQYINKKYGRSGRLWQSRFASCTLDPAEYLWSVARYVEAAPVRARLAKKPWEFAWSSAGHHVEGRPDPLVGESDWLSPRRVAAYRKFLVADDPEETERIRGCTQTGRPLGNMEFILCMEKRLHRRLRPKPSGRPRKHARK